MLNHFVDFLENLPIGEQKHPHVAGIDVDELDDDFELLPLLALLVRDIIEDGQLLQHLGQLYATQCDLILLVHEEGPALVPANHVHLHHTLIRILQQILVIVRQLLVYHFLAVASEQFLVVQGIDVCYCPQGLVDGDEVYVHLIPLHYHLSFELLVPVPRQHLLTLTAPITITIYSCMQFIIFIQK